ncbi:MAG: hypothetical protein ACTSV6_00030 [Candidatus Heimdallarchaeota archaeon]
MLSKTGLSLIMLAFSFILFSSLSYAAIVCDPCEPRACFCSIDDCSSGLLRIYSSSTCRIPGYEYTFSNNKFTWNFAETGTYYFKAFCDDGNVSACYRVTVKTPTTTTIPTTSTRPPTAKEECPFECCVDDPRYTDKPCPSGERCIDGECIPIAKKKGYFWVIGVLIAVVAVILILIFFLSRKKPRKTFEELYRKWGR